jgi:hypothetical protein
MDAKVVGIIDRDGGLINENGFTFEEIRALFLPRQKQISCRKHDSFEEINQKYGQ